MTRYLEFEADLSNPEVAEAFDDFTYWSSMFGQLLFRYLPLAPRLVCLDVGCGTGFPLLELADRLGPAAHVHGIDSWDHAVTRSLLKVRIRGNTNVDVTHGNAAEMPYDDDSFDLIVSNLGANNFDSPAAVMAECHRVCKPNGRIAMTTNLVGHMVEFYQIYEQVLIATGHRGLIAKLDQHQNHRATPEGLRRLFSSAGFEVTRYRSETFMLRYADGSAFLNAYLSRLGFLDGWLGVLDGTHREQEIFERLEERMNNISLERGGFNVSIPAAYIEGQKS